MSTVPRFPPTEKEYEWDPPKVIIYWVTSAVFGALAAMCLVWIPHRVWVDYGQTPMQIEFIGWIMFMVGGFALWEAHDRGWIRWALEPHD